MHRWRPLPHRKYLSCLNAGLLCGRVISMRNSSDTIGNWTGDFWAWSAVLRPTASPRATGISTKSKEFLKWLTKWDEHHIGDRNSTVWGKRVETFWTTWTAKGITKRSHADGYVIRNTWLTALSEHCTHYKEPWLHSDFCCTWGVQVLRYPNFFLGNGNR